MDSVYIIIVTYNGVEWIDKCLKSVFYSSIPVNVIVVDNLSTDNTKKVIKARYPSVRLIESEINLGFGKANNIGIKEALLNGADYVFLLNQDAWVDADTIEGLINIHKKNTEYGILSPVHLNGKGTAMDYNFSQACNAPDCPDLLSDLYVGQSKDIYVINFVMAALWLMPKATLLKVGLFDPLFPHYGEDMDYTQRARSFNLKIGICPNYRGYHDRENRAPSDKRDAQIRNLHYLTILKNNNRKMIYSVFEFNLHWINNIFSLLANRKWTFFFKEIAVGVKFWFTIPKIIGNRAYTKKEAAFLRIE